ncbi:lysylphosphatidylglycerol synthase transmembrane domain-containing protein [Spirillospora sp. CA-294931]|uniref:lysylphosphatidylglycerol synthase transmembrane domain-containing protein n=1 Tax=Spirillospora sp. CA-294931 TaxID=3240042 RepID=UPI003D929010
METIADGAERAAPAGFPSLGGDAAVNIPNPLPPASARRSPWTRWALAGFVLAALAGTVLLVYGTAPFRAAGTAFRDVRWEFLPALLALSVLHYVFAAITLRGAAGRPLPLLATTLSQFTAAAANRVTPSGLGAVAVNTRYLVCHGMPLANAAVAVGVMQLAGIPADLLLITAVIAIGQDGRMLDAMGTQAGHALDSVPMLPVLIGIGILLPAGLLWGRRALRSTLMERAISGTADLCRRPGDLAITIGASAATTLIMAVAFALSVLAVPGPAGAGDVLPLLAAYMVGAAAGAALPSPGGVGSTEAALVGSLAALGIGAGSAVQAVLLFRVVTFWAPVPVGLLAARTSLKSPSPAYNPSVDPPHSRKSAISGAISARLSPKAK